MENFGLQLINSSVLGQTDFISLFTTYLSDYVFVLRWSRSICYFDVVIK